MTNPEEEQIYRLAAGLLISTLSSHLLRTLAPPVQEPAKEPEPDTLTTPEAVIALPHGSELRSYTGTLFQRTPAGVIRLADGKVLGPKDVSLPATVTRRVPAEDPAVLRTIHDVANAAKGTVIRDVNGKVLQKAERHMWYIPGNYVGLVSQEIALPARVLA